MIKISLDTQLINLNNLHNKKVGGITLEEIISLIFYAANTMTNRDETWKDYYKKFQLDLSEQNNKGWPKLIFTRNDSRKRLDSLMTETFISSDNLLLLLLQLLYIEKNKKNNIINSVYVSFERYDILSHRLDNIDNQKDIKQLSLDKMFEILEAYINIYMSLYNNKMLFEYKLSKNILTMLNN
uniref:Uncharacterized protein n=1 Tax=viral metagenome TaxID=1070528 RepID=A0A6C0CBI5_9ZZZZ